MWNYFFKDIPQDLYSIFIHYKTDTELKYFNNYKIKNCIETSWGNISIVKAQNLLLRHALADPDNYKFIFISQSCIPLKPFYYVYHKLISDDNSYFNLANSLAPANGDKLLQAYLPEEVKKASQWSILNRLHTYIVVNHDYLLPLFQQAFYSADEYYYLSTITRFANEKLNFVFNSACRGTTFTNWSDMFDYPFCYIIELSNIDKKKISIAGLNAQESEEKVNSIANAQISILKEYNDITKDEIDFLLREKCLFGRKFNSECTIDNKYKLDEYLKFKFSLESK